MNGDLRWPDVFIAGAPKCGTTSLYLTLKATGDFFCPETKEPRFFLPEWPSVQALPNKDAYLASFADARDDQSLVDASVHYLYSETALAAIARQVPQAKIVVMLRNPMALVPSLHEEELFQQHEDVSDFATAWRLQSERERGRSLPPRCPTPAWAMLRKIADFGPQLRRLYGNFPKDQVFVGIVEEMRLDASAFLADLSRFLGRESVRDVSMTHVNSSRRWRSASGRAVYRAAGVAHKGLRRIGLEGAARRLTGSVGVAPLKALKRRAIDASPRAPIDPATRREMAAVFAPTVAETEAILGRELPAWRNALDEAE